MALPDQNVARSVLPRGKWFTRLAEGGAVMMIAVAVLLYPAVSSELSPSDDIISTTPAIHGLVDGTVDQSGPITGTEPDPAAIEDGESDTTPPATTSAQTDTTPVDPDDLAAIGIGELGNLGAGNKANGDLGGGPAVSSGDAGSLLRTDRTVPRATPGSEKTLAGDNLAAPAPTTTNRRSVEDDGVGRTVSGSGESRSGDDRRSPPTSRPLGGGASPIAAPPTSARPDPDAPVATKPPLSTTTQPAPTTSPPATTSVPATPTSYNFSGAGWGHGVGMSQYGAYGRALAGQDHPQILGAYYPGTSLATNGSVTSLSVLIGHRDTAVVEGQNLVVDGLGAPIEANRFEISQAGGLLSVAIPGLECPAPSSEPAVSSSAPAAACTPCGQQTCVARRLDFTGAGLVVGPDSRSIGRSHLRLAADTEGIALVIPDVALEEYLLDISEVPASWPGAALRSQAIAARTFAVRTVSARRISPAWSRPFDLEATDQDQVWTGWSAGRGGCAGCDSRWAAAVGATNAQVLTFEGRPIEALYSASNGGYSANPALVFAESRPYLVSAEDPYDEVINGGVSLNPHSRWSRTFTAEELSAILSTDDRTSVGNLSSIRLEAVADSGRTDGARIVLTGDAGTKVVPALEFRAVVNSVVEFSRALPSTRYVMLPA